MIATVARLRAAIRADAGFGLIEIVVSMFLLAALSLLILPLLIQGLQISRQNAAVASAVQFMDAELDAAHRATSCGSIPTGAAPAQSDSRGTAFTITRERDSCPSDAADYPAAIRFTVTVTTEQDGEDVVLASGSTLVYVEGA